MKKVIQSLKSFLVFGARSFVLMGAIAKTYIKRALFKFSKNQIKYPHLESFIKKRKQTGCNLTTLHSTLDNLVKENKRVMVSSLVEAQNTYTSKEEILKHLPTLNDSTEIVAIPVALKIFKCFRHFVTIIVDKNDNFIEFYDSIGFSTKDYNHAKVWGKKCKNEDLLSLPELMEAVKSKYQIKSVVENKDIHQTDFNQCALFVYDRIYKRGVKGFSFKEAAKSPFSSKQAFI